jgi:hypothetical protein
MTIFPPNAVWAFANACEFFHKEAPPAAAFQPVGAPRYSACLGLAPQTPVACVSPQDALVMRAMDRVGGVPPVCHLGLDGRRPLHLLWQEGRGTRPDYADLV